VTGEYDRFAAGIGTNRANVFNRLGKLKRPEADKELGVSFHIGWDLGKLICCRSHNEQETRELPTTELCRPSQQASLVENLSGEFLNTFGSCECDNDRVADIKPLSLKTALWILTTGGGCQVACGVYILAACDERLGYLEAFDGVARAVNPVDRGVCGERDGGEDDDGRYQRFKE
jgi:hypothetical protein